ncbi:MAG: hypothetical protein ACYS8W_09195, partial [Planctomycetota bacterium]
MHFTIVIALIAGFLAENLRVEFFWSDFEHFITSLGTHQVNCAFPATLEKLTVAVVLPTVSKLSVRSFTGRNAMFEFGLIKNAIEVPLVNA